MKEFFIEKSSNVSEEAYEKLENLVEIYNQVLVSRIGTVVDLDKEDKSYKTSCKLSKNADGSFNLIKTIKIKSPVLVHDIEIAIESDTSKEFKRGGPCLEE